MSSPLSVDMQQLAAVTEENYKPTRPEAIFSCLFLTAMIPVHGWVLTVLWVWFLVPLGVPVIGLAHAVGIRVIWSWFSSNELLLAYAKTEDQYYRALALTITKPLAALFLGSIAKYFM